VSARWIPALAVAFLLPACGGGRPSPAVDASPAPSAPEVSSPADPADELLGRAPASDRPSTELATPRVTLLDTGEAPHRPLRYAFAPGRVEVPAAGTLTATYAIAGATAGGEPMPDRAPTTIAAPSEVTITELDADGTATISVDHRAGRVTDPGGLDGEELRTVEQALDRLEEVRATYRIDDRGFVTPVEVEAPDPAPRWGGADVTALAHRVPAFVPPLPAEPVGVGATWTVTRPTEIAGVFVDQAVRVELLERDGDLLELLVTVQDAGPTDGGAVTGSEDVEVTFASLEVDGGGNVTTRLDRPVPVGASHGLTATFAFVVIDDDGRRTVQRTVVSDASYEVDG
jgi:hypothetical protein